MKSAGRVRSRRSLALAAACLLGLAGCRNSGASDDDPTISVPDTVATTTATAPTTATTALIPLDQDPPVIDLAYAQRVLDEISRLDGEASRILYREKRVTPEYEALVQSFLYGEALKDAQTAVTSDLSVGLVSYRDPPGNPLVTAKRIVTTRPDCIALIADSDFTPRYRAAVKKQDGIGVVLQRNIRPTAEERLRNPTNWVQTDGGTIASGTSLEAACD